MVFPLVAILAAYTLSEVMGKIMDFFMSRQITG